MMMDQFLSFTKKVKNTSPKKSLIHIMTSFQLNSAPIFQAMLDLKYNKIYQTMYYMHAIPNCKVPKTVNKRPPSE